MLHKYDTYRGFYEYQTCFSLPYSTKVISRDHARQLARYIADQMSNEVYYELLKHIGKTIEE